MLQFERSAVWRPYAVRFLGLAALGTVVVLAGCSSSSQAIDGPGTELRTFTGAHTRVVWVQGDGTDPYAAGDNLVLMGFDTDDNRGERVILEERGSYVKPLLTPKGTRIVYSTRPQGDGPEVFVVNWDGSGHARLAKGFALAVWEDPADGTEWVYLGTDNDQYNFATVVRVRIDAPSSSELVWNKTIVSGDTFQVSADGRLAGGLFPWPDAGIAQLPNGEWRKVGEGCWTAMGTARSPMFWYFDGAHRNLTMVDLGTEKRWMVPINQAPGFDNPEVYHPRWTTHPRFLALSGPYDQGGANQVRSGGAQTEIWLGRFSDDFTQVEAWVRVTHNTAGDSYPDVWMDRERSPYPTRPSGRVGPAEAGDAPESGSTGDGAARVVLEARLTHAGPIPTPQSILPYRNALVVNEYEIVRVVEGAYTSRTVQVAQWAIRDQRLLPGARKTPGAVHRLMLERYDAHPELEGERLITDLGASDQPLYYEIDS